VSRSSRPPPIQNHLLAALPEKVYKRLIPHLESVDLPSMEVLYEGGEPLTHVYFPSNGLISLLVVMEDETPIEVGLIGNEGMFGVPVVLGMNATPTRALILMPGSASRMKAQVLREELERCGALQDILQRYTHALFTQVSQSAACISSHELYQRLSRWLVMTHDRAPGDQFEMKHEFMAMMLGVTRSVVTRAAGNLQEKKMIRYTRGRVTILDRRRLEATACECYGMVKDEYARSTHSPWLRTVNRRSALKAEQQEHERVSRIEKVSADKKVVWLHSREVKNNKHGSEETARRTRRQREKRGGRSG
jgi:CRP-like cAMP-binding protein